MKVTHGKRIDIVSIKLCKEHSVIYSPRIITCPQDSVNLLKPFLESKDREELIVTCLDTKNQPSCINVCSVGTLNASLVHPREVFKPAFLSNASSIIISHNHPSGDPEPSSEDISITKRINTCGEILGIQLLDHIIIGETDKYFSFKEQKLF